MKNITKIVAFFLLVCLCLPLFSCSDGTVDTDGTSGEDGANGSNNAGNSFSSMEPVCTVGYRDGIIYEDMYFYIKLRGGILKYYDLTDIESGSYNVNTDPLVEDLYSNPAALGRGYFAISPELTAENNGIPVLIIAKMRSENSIDKLFIYSYNTATNDADAIFECEDANIQTLHLYGDTIVFTTNNGDKGYDIHRVDIDGDNYVKKENKKSLYYTSTVYDDRIYYTDDKTNTLYSASLMLDDEQKLFSVNTVSVIPFIVDDYIYYAKPAVKYVEYEERKHIAYTVCRRHLSDLSKEEVFMENIFALVRRGNKLFFSYTEPRRITEGIVAVYSPLYEYSFETGEKRQLYDLSGTLKDRSWIVINEDYVVFVDIDYSTGDTFQTRTDTTIVLNLATGEETVLPEE